MKLESREPKHKQLDRALARFVDSVFAGDDDGARHAFGDAQALMPRPREVLEDGRSWVFAEQQLATQVGDEMSDSVAQARLARLRGRR